MEMTGFRQRKLLSNSKCYCTFVFLLFSSLLNAYENYLLFQKNRCVMRKEPV